MQGGRIITLAAGSVALIGDLHGDLRALCRLLREVGCFWAAPPGSSRLKQRAAWDQLDAMCSACPVGTGRDTFPNPELLRGVRHMGGVEDGRSVVFCGDVIDNRRPGVAGSDEGFGICAYSDSVELVVETVARLCRDSPRGAVTWLLGNHDIWPFLASCRQCRSYAPLHQCASDGSYNVEFRRKLIGHLLEARAQACLIANGVLCCHGGLSGLFVQDVLRNAPSPTAGVSARDTMVRTINLQFDRLLHAVRASPDARLTPKQEVGEFGWCLSPHALLWCRPQVSPQGFAALFNPQTFASEESGGAPGVPAGWEELASELRGLCYCVAHTMQQHGVSMATVGSVANPKLMRQEARIKLKPPLLLSVDTGQSRGFGANNRVVQATRVSDDGYAHVTRNLV